MQSRAEITQKHGINLRWFRFGVCCLKYPLAVFFVVFVIRMVPEVIMSSYPLGFDTVAYYIPITRQWLSEGVNVWHAMSIAPFFYVLLSGVTAMGVPFVVSLKIFPSLLHGLLALVIFYYARKGLDWSPKKSVLVSLLATLYFVALRISWDMLRNELGLIFLFLALTFSSVILKGENVRLRHYVLFSLVAVLTVLSHQLTALLLLVIFAGLVVWVLLKGGRVEVRNFVVLLMPAFVLFLAFNVFSLSVFAGEIVGNVAVLPFQNPVFNVGFFFFCFLPLLPFVLCGFRYFRGFLLVFWCGWVLFTLLSPLLFPSLLGLGGHRWTLLLVFPFSFLAVEGLDRLKLCVRSVRRCVVFGVVVLVFVCVVGWLSVGFMVGLPSKPVVYFDTSGFNQFSFYFQSSMLQNTVPIEQLGDFEGVVSWLDVNVGGGSVVVLPAQFYGLALMSLRDSVDVRDAGELSPFRPGGEQVLLGMCVEAVEGGSESVFVVWWTPDSGWYNSSFSFSSFVEVQNFGAFSVYRFLGV